MGLKKNSNKTKNTITFIARFTIDDFKNKYAGSVLGLVWAFLQPLMTIMIYYFVFQLGFKSQPIENFPFILWLISGLIPWFFVSESISNATASMLEYNYLVKKVVFNINILPVARVLSVLIVQFFLICLTGIIFWCFGYSPDLYYLQIFYYLLYMMILVLGIVYLTSSLYVFFKDIIQIVGVVLQVWFWMTPFVWDISAMDERIQTILHCNPLYYVANGYRNTFIYKVWFWENWKETLVYWSVAIILMFIGKKTFNKLKPHFADVL